MAGSKLPGGQGGGGPFDAELPLDLGDRLPWLDDNEEEERDASTGRMIAALVAVLLLLGLGGGGLWCLHHRRQMDAMAVAGGVIKAPPGPYKVRPANPGGAIAAGTGDTAFKVAQGKNPRASVVDEGAGPSASGAPVIGVQLGAFSAAKDAEAAWPVLTQRFPMLADVHHRVVETPGDLGSVFGLQAVTETLAGASALCAQLRTSGMKCQVKE